MFHNSLDTDQHRKGNRRNKEKSNQGRVKGEQQTTERYKTRLMTLNVYSILNNLQAAERYKKTNRVHVAVSTETHVQEGDTTDIQIKGYTLTSTCKRRAGEVKGGMAIYAHGAVPFNQGEHRTTTAQNEMEYCSTIVFPKPKPARQAGNRGGIQTPRKRSPGV